MLTVTLLVKFVSITYLTLATEGEEITVLMSIYICIVFQIMLAC